MENIQYYKNHAYKIQQNEFAQSPNDWDDQELFLVFDHNQFLIKREGFDVESMFYNTPEYEKHGYVFPVYAYIHSGVSLSLTNDSYPFNDKWDVSNKGFVFVTYSLRDDLTDDMALEYAEKLIEEWNTYLSKEVYDIYIYTVNECKHCGNIEYEELDCLCEVYGYDNAIDEAKEFINTL